MTDLERIVWATVFANEFSRERKFRLQYPQVGDIDGISGFSCGEVADVAVVQLREALAGDDAEYLIPVKEQPK